MKPAQRSLAVAMVAVGVWFVSPGLSADAQAACQWRFRLPLSLSLVQSNATRVDITNTGTYLKATAYNSRGHFYGSVQWWRSIPQPQVKFVINWRDGTSGVYTGTIQSNGYLSGFTYDATNPLSRASWRIVPRRSDGLTGLVCVP